MTKPKIVSIYSGAGGIDCGFHAAGFQTVFAVDSWELACESLRSNFPRCDVHTADIQEVDFKNIRKKYGLIDGLVGGPPCPPFSKSRFYRREKERGLEDKSGFITITNYFRALKELKPKFFFFENVHGFIYKPHQDALELVKRESESLGYKLTYKVVNAADYGVPQTRERFFCIGVKLGNNEFVFPEPTHFAPDLVSQGLKKWVTCGAVLDDLDYPLPEDDKMEAGSKHRHLLKKVPPGDNYLFFTKERGHPKPEFKWRSRYWSFLLKLSRERPSWTIQASHSNNMGPFHWRNRFLRINELKRIQSFPDDYVLVGKYRDQWRQIGNAVPPLLAEKFAKALKKQYFKNERS